MVLAVVGSWLEPKAGQKVDFSGEEIPRDKILSWGELKEMQDSGFVEIASHSYHLHRGITGNPQGNSEPAATTRFYDVKTKTYENDSQYQARIYNDLKRIISYLKSMVYVHHVLWCGHMVAIICKRSKLLKSLVCQLPSRLMMAQTMRNNLYKI